MSDVVGLAGNVGKKRKATSCLDSHIAKVISSVKREKQGCAQILSFIYIYKKKPSQFTKNVLLKIEGAN